MFQAKCVHGFHSIHGIHGIYDVYGMTFNGIDNILLIKHSATRPPQYGT